MWDNIRCCPADYVNNSHASSGRAVESLARGSSDVDTELMAVLRTGHTVRSKRTSGGVGPLWGRDVTLLSSKVLPASVANTPAVQSATRRLKWNSTPQWNIPYVWLCVLGLITVAVLTVASLPHERTAWRVGMHSFTLSLSKKDPANSGASKNSAQPGALEHGNNSAAVPLPCETSGYCSLGVSKMWRGDVATNDGLREMLHAVSFKKEITYTMSHLEGFMLEMALNVIMSAEAQGYGHSVVLATNPTACSNIPLNATVSCLWDSRDVVEAGDVNNWWYKRWDLFARMVRMGFNVLSLDADTMITAEMYSFVKEEPFSKYNALFQDDGGGVNCGVVYFQNCHPSGPAAWMAVEHPYRTSRQRENQTHMQEVYEGWEMGRDTWEQPFWNQVLSCVSHGKPYSMVLDNRTPAEWGREMEPYRMTQQIQQISWPQEWRNVTGLEAGPLVTYGNLSLPIVDDAWWQLRRKYFYRASAGNVSSQFMKLIRTSMVEPFYELGKPWENLDLPQEHAAFLPCWFTCGYAYRGNQGF